MLIKRITCLFGLFMVMFSANPIDVLPMQTGTDKYIPPEQNEVQVGFAGIDMPIGKILLVRKERMLCAVKFMKFWIEESTEGKFAEYAVYCLSGNPIDGNSKYTHANGRASLLKPRGLFYPLIWQPGKPEINIGSLKLLWAPKGLVCFYERGKSPKDYGIELAPTPWEDIAQVELSDSRINGTDTTKKGRMRTFRLAISGAARMLENKVTTMTVVLHRGSQKTRYSIGAG